MSGLNLWRGESNINPLISNWDSFNNEFERMFREMDNMLTPWRSRLQDLGTGSLSSLAFDVDEEEDSYIVSVDLPGVRKDDVNIEVQGNQLVITGERKRAREGKEGSIRRMEKRYGKFQRVLTLPEGTDADRIEAHFENGVLQLAIPKSERVKPKKITIGEGGFLKKLIDKESKKVS